MLKNLYVKNYALIEELTIAFDEGFGVITGETGAGKSILLGAIGLLMGQRAETRMLKPGTDRCVIEALFDLSDYGMETFFDKADLDFDGHECVVRRELMASGKSRAFVNDTPVQVTLLRDLGGRLIDIHSQHQNLLLADENFQMDVVDIMAGNDDLRSAYRERYDAYQQVTRQLDEARRAQQQGHADEDYLRHQLAQLEALDLEPGKQEAMEQESSVLEHAEEIKSILYGLYNLLQGSDEGLDILAMLHEGERQLMTLQTMMPDAATLRERLASCHIELRDIADEIAKASERVEVDPQRLTIVNEWLSSLYAQLQRHHVASAEDLIAIYTHLQEQIEAIDHSDALIVALTAQQQTCLQQMTTAAQRLTQSRVEAARVIEQQLTQRLVPLGISNVQFRVEIQPKSNPSPAGMDSITFLFSANKNAPLQPISTVASGGEISRVMLSLKAMISHSVHLPTIIFDEIDTGVSGQTAERMALMMKEMGAEGRQVISITHLPQIAALAASHYRAYKEDDDTGTTSHIVRLNPDERVTEIAHMLSGSTLTPAAIENAKALLASNT